MLINIISILLREIKCSGNTMTAESINILFTHTPEFPTLIQKYSMSRPTPSKNQEGPIREH